MKRVILFFVGLFVVLNLISTETRTASMGEVGFYMDDISNIFIFPGTISDYKNQLLGELTVNDNDNDYYFGFHFTAFGGSVLGIYRNRPITIAIPDTLFGDNGYFPGMTLSKSQSFIFGKKFDNFNFGTILTYELDVFHDNRSTHYLSLGLGFSNDILDLGLNIGLPGAKYLISSGIASIEKTWNGIALNFNGRMFIDKSKYKIGPIFYLNYFPSIYKKEPDENLGQDEEQTKFTNFNLGIGLGINYRFDKNNIFVFEINPFGMDKKITDVKGDKKYREITYFLPTIYSGLEAKLKKWLTGRLGITHLHYTRSKSKITYQNFLLSLGIGVEFKKFSVDALIDKGIFFDGPYFIGGKDNSLASKLSISYKF